MGTVEVIVGVQRRRRWSAAEKLEHAFIGNKHNDIIKMVEYLLSEIDQKGTII